MQARYTVVLKDLMDNEQTSQKISTALSTYPLYEPKSEVTNIPKRSELNQRLLNTYKYREIGFETVGRFLDELQMTMCEIMPYYNEMYKTIEIMAGLENPFDNVDFTETYTETSSGTTKNQASTETDDNGSSIVDNEAHAKTDTTESAETKSNAKNNSKAVHSATPQSELSIPAKDIDSVDYADDVTWNQSEDSGSEETTRTSETNSNSDSNQVTETTNKSKTDASGTQTTQGNVEHTLSKKGNQGVNTYAHDMIEFRQSIIDVTNQIINDDRISELFMRVF